MGTVASKQASIFSRALTELDGKLDVKLGVKLEPLLAEQRRLGRQMDGILEFFQILAVVLPIFVALWIIDLQAEVWESSLDSASQRACDVLCRLCRCGCSQSPVGITVSEAANCQVVSLARKAADEADTSTNSNSGK